MTNDELRAAAERMNRMAKAKLGTPMATAAKAWVEDNWAVSTAYLAEHRADDEFPLEWEWLSKAATLHHDQGYWDIPPSGDVWWEIGPISFECDPYQADPGEPVETVAVNWQVDGEELPRMLVPETRGQLRQLCRLLGVQLKEPG